MPACGPANRMAAKGAPVAMLLCDPANSRLMRSARGRPISPPRPQAAIIASTSITRMTAQSTAITPQPSDCILPPATAELKAT